MIGKRRVAHHAGRMAALAERVSGQPLPPCPYRPGTMLATYWTWGVEKAGHLLDQLFEHRP